MVEPRYTIKQYEQAESEARRAPEDMKKEYQSRAFKVWMHAFNDVPPDQASTLPPKPQREVLA